MLRTGSDGVGSRGLERTSAPPSHRALLLVVGLAACRGDDGGDATTTGAATTGVTTTGVTTTGDATTGAVTTAVEEPTTAGVSTTGAGPGETTGDPPIDPTTGDPTVDPTESEPHEGCEAGADPGGLRWALGSADFAGQIPHVAGSPNGDTAIVSTIAAYSETADVAVNVVDADGAPRWTDTYVGEAGLADYGLGITVDAEGFVYVLAKDTILFEEGMFDPTEDMRLVILRYAPDGTRLWRWERPHPPVASGESFNPTGAIAVVGDAVALLEYIAEEPPRLVRLDKSGAVLSEVVFVDVPPAALWRTIGRTGVHFVGKLEGSDDIWAARYTFAAEPVWTDQFAAPDAFPQAVVGDDVGGTWIAWAPSQEWYAEYRLRRYEPDGGVAFTRSLGFGEFPGEVSAAGLHCDGTTPLLAGAVFGVAEPQDLPADPKYLWSARLAADGAQQWTDVRKLGSKFHQAGARMIVGAPDGDVLVVGEFMTDDSSYADWVGRFAGG